MLTRSDSHAPYAVIDSYSSSSNSGLENGKLTVPFNANQLAEDLYAAINSNKKDTVIDIVCRRPIEDVEDIAVAFRQKYHDSPSHFVKAHMGGTDRYFLAVVSGCAVGSILEYEARALRAAMEGIGCDTDALIEILVGRTVQEIREIKSAFQQLFGRALEVDLHKNLHGSTRHFFEALMNVDRKIAPRSLDPEADARALFNAGEGRQGKDDTVWIRILTERPDEHLQRVVALYPQLFHSTIENAIQKEFNGEMQRALHMLVASLTDRVNEIATLFEKSMKGYGLNESKLIRLVIRFRAPESREAIKKSYSRKYNKSLISKIKSEISGDFRRAVLASWGEHE
ncbi:Annexin A13 [Gonapodya sp. JEL0774]|nr:Annexin A13 [Gonapodya sp. JEL0774]